MKVLFFLSLVLTCFFSFGCSRGSGGSGVSETTLSFNGNLKAPETLNSDLLGNLLEGTDSQSRRAFENARIYVNNRQFGTAQIETFSTTPNWSIRIPSVPESETGLYVIKVVANSIILKSIVASSQKDNFDINMRTTATAVIAKETNNYPDFVMERYPAHVHSLEKVLNEACKKTKTQIDNDSIINYYATQNKLARVKALVKLTENIHTHAQLAYFSKENDLTGNGRTDLLIEQVAGGSRLRFRTTLSDRLTFKENVSGLQDYEDEQLLRDFERGATTNYIDVSFNEQANNNVILGLYLHKSAAADIYLKMFIRGIEIDSDQEFKGVFAEYKLVKTETTAISSGQKTFVRQDIELGDKGVHASNFIETAQVQSGLLSYIDQETGLGCPENKSRLVRLIDGKPSLENLAGAEPYSAGGGYHFNTRNALQHYYNDAKLEVGHVFSVFFPGTEHYALFKILSIDEEEIKVEYIVNSSENEWRFRN